MNLPTASRMLAAVLPIALAAAPLAPPARAAGCAPVPKAELPLALVRQRPLVTLKIDGAPATMVLDTGAERTLLGEAAARRLGLAAHYTYAHAIAGVGGAVNAGEVRPEHVTFGGTAMPGFFIAVARVTFPPVDGLAVDGLLGADMLVDYDLELDFAHGRARLYAPAACDAPAVPWPPGYGEVKAHKSMHRHLFFPVTLDGREVMAFIDTGAQVSALSAGAAQHLGLTGAALALDPTLGVHGVAGAVSGHMHRFARLEVAGIDWRPTPFAVMPLRLDDADLILGVDFLLAHRVWLSYAGRVVLVAPP